MFEYTAQAPWPKPQPQIDWVDQVATVESWLNNYIGVQQWTWVNNSGPYITVAFEHPKHRTLFLLQWA